MLDRTRKINHTRGKPTFVGFIAMRFTLPNCLARLLPYSLAISVLLSVIFSVSPTSAYATQQQYSQDTLKEYRQQGHIERLLMVHTFLRSLISELSCQTAGVKRTSPTQDCFVKDTASNSLRLMTPAEAEQANYQRGGLLVFSGNAVEFVFTKPTDTGAYLRYLAKDFGIATKTYADEQESGIDCALGENSNKAECKAGTGFRSLTQVQNLFVLVRNIVYLLLAATFIIVGILIMVRHHIDPRTVMTIQNQIPKAVIAILLITFSYSIAGVMIDAMWTVTYVGINAVAGTRGQCRPEDDRRGVVPFQDHLNERQTLMGAATNGILNNPLAFTTDLFGNATGCFGTFDGISGLAVNVANTFGDILTRAGMTALGADPTYREECGISIPGLGDNNFGACVQMIFHEIIKAIFTFIGFFIVIIAILAALFRLWFTLIKNYIMLLIDIILAPMLILFGLIPQSNYGFGMWAREMIAQLAIFPAAAILLTMAAVIASDHNFSNPEKGAFVPPLVANPNIADNMGALVAFGFILIVPGLLDTLREALKSPEPKQSGLVTAGIGLAAGKTMGAGKGVEERISGRNKIDLDREEGDRRRGLGRVPFVGKRFG